MFQMTNFRVQHFVNNNLQIESSFAKLQFDIFPCHILYPYNKFFYKLKISQTVKVSFPKIIADIDEFFK